MFRVFHITLLATLIYASGVCQDPLPSVIEKDTILTSEGSPYYIQQNLSIIRGITLKINAGTQIILSKGVTVTNNGRLVIEGSEEENVLFTSDSPETKRNYISNRCSFYTNHLIIRRGVRFITSSGGTIYVSNSIISNSVLGDLIQVDNSEVNFEYNLTDLVLLSGTGNITGSPQFIDAGNPDRDNDGLGSLADADDRDPDGTRLDLGCYPYYQAPVSFVEISPSKLSIQMDPTGELMFLELNEDPGSRIQVGIFNLSGIR